MYNRGNRVESCKEGASANLCATAQHFATSSLLLGVYFAMARKTREEALETRQRILDTAARMFGQQGIGATSLQDIAAAADVSRGAIYWHFKNKSDLLSTLLDDVAAQFDQALLACQPQAEDPIEQARRHAVSSITLLNEDNNLRHFFQALIY